MMHLAAFSSTAAGNSLNKNSLIALVHKIDVRSQVSDSLEGNLKINMMLID